MVLGHRHRGSLVLVRLLQIGCKGQCKHHYCRHAGILASEWGLCREFSNSVWIREQTKDTLSLKGIYITPMTQTSFQARLGCRQVEVPCKIYGDIHGQLRDLLLLSPPQNRFLESECEWLAAAASHLQSGLMRKKPVHPRGQRGNPALLVDAPSLVEPSPPAIHERCRWCRVLHYTTALSELYAVDACTNHKSLRPLSQRSYGGSDPTVPCVSF